MIVTSKINNTDYFYIQIPRTATVSYERLFFPDREQTAAHVHYMYYEYKSMPGFSVIRNPRTRFISSLYHLRKIQKNPNSILNKTHMYDVKNNKILLDPSRPAGTRFTDIFQSEDFFYNFFYDSFYKNCEPKHANNMFDIFDADSGKIVLSFFITQVAWAYFPKVQIFRYENLADFNQWIERELGYDTSTLQKMNVTLELDKNIDIDFTSSKFKELTKYLFHDDFKYFNYEFPI